MRRFACTSAEYCVRLPSHVWLRLTGDSHARPKLSSEQVGRREGRTMIALIMAVALSSGVSADAVAGQWRTQTRNGVVEIPF